MEELIVEGYEFSSKEDATIARSEIQKIELIKERLNYDDIEGLMNVYNKMIDQRIFRTPIGIQFLYQLQNELKRADVEIRQIKMIPIYSIYKGTPIMNSKELKVAKEKKDLNKERIRKFRISIFFNIIFAVMIIIMFLIAVNSKNPNIINYKKVLTNQYSSWEEELTERENVVREKELELKLEKE